MAELARTVITEAKKAPGRAWLGEVSAVVLQQSLRDLDAAYRNFFAGLRGRRARVGAPRFKSRKDARQAVRFTANARWSITPTGRLRLPKIGDIRVRWSRALPSVPSSVTIIKDAAGRIFASFVVETTATLLPENGAEVGIDLGLAHFAVLSDGTKHTSPRFLRRAEKKLKKLHKELSRKRKGSNNRFKARLKVARQHAKVADARREFHHQLSTSPATSLIQPWDPIPRRGGQVRRHPGVYRALSRTAAVVEPYVSPRTQPASSHGCDDRDGCLSVVWTWLGGVV